MPQNLCVWDSLGARDSRPGQLLYFQGCPLCWSLDFQVSHSQAREEGLPGGRSAIQPQALGGCYIAKRVRGLAPGRSSASRAVTLGEPFLTSAKDYISPVQ